MRRIVDPPSGWRFGFPREYDPKEGETFADWLLRMGYPATDIPLAERHSRWWDSEMTHAYPVDAHRIHQEAQRVADLRAQLLLAFPELEQDDAALNDTLSGESTLQEQILAILNSAEDDKCMAAALEIRIHDMTERLSRFTERQRKKRELAAQAMGEAGLKKIEDAAMTVSLVAGKPSVRIIDEAALPEAFLRHPKPVPDKTAIGNALRDGEKVSGAELSNPGFYIVVRRT